MGNASSQSNDSPSDPPFDLAAALSALGNRPHLLCELSALFLQQRSGMVDAVQIALEQHNVAEVERAVHSFRGAIGYFRAAPLWRITALMHDAATKGDLVEVQTYFPEFTQCVEALATALAETLNQSARKLSSPASVESKPKRLKS